MTEQHSGDGDGSNNTNKRKSSESIPILLKEIPERSENPGMTPIMHSLLLSSIKIPSELRNHTNFSFSFSDTDSDSSCMNASLRSSLATQEEVEEESEEVDKLKRAIEESFVLTPEPEIKLADDMQVLYDMPRYTWLGSIKRLKKERNGDTNSDRKTEMCSICMDEFEDGDDVVKTRCCGGMAHFECMEHTLYVMTRCPFCKSASLR